VLSRENAGNDIKVLSPWIAAHLALDLSLSEKVYARFEPSFGTFSRATKKTTVSSVDTIQHPNVVTLETISNKVRVYDLFVRALVGYDFSPSFTVRAGLLVGYDIAKTGASQCSDSTSSGVSYGGTIMPAILRVGEKKAVELAFVMDYSSHAIPRCDIPFADRFVVEDNAITIFPARIIKQRIATAMLGLHGTYMFW
jgi:hypothetical protein